MTDRYGILASLNINPELYQKIGEVTVMAGQLEARIKTLPLSFLDLGSHSAWALTAHLNMASLIDMCKAMARAIWNNDFGQAWVDALGKAKAAYDRRSNLIHYTFQPDMGGGPHGFRTTARTKINQTYIQFTSKELAATLDDLNSAYSDIEDCAQALMQVRGRRSPAPLGAVDKVDSQGARTLIQGCLLGDGDGSRADDGQGMEVFRAVCACDRRQERAAALRSPAGA